MTRSTGKYVDIEVFVKHETERAILVCDDSEGTTEGVWVPKSQASGWGDVGEVSTITLPEWIATERGLI